MFAANQTPQDTKKDSTFNAEQTGKFCWNMATYELREAVNASAEQVAYDVDEFVRAKVTPVKASLSDVPMVKESPIRFECEYHSTLRLPGNPPMGSVSVVIGKVVGVHIDESILTEGKIDLLKAKPIARCGYYEYTVVSEIFEMVIPGDEKVLRGLEGSAIKNTLTHEENRAGMQTEADPVNNARG